MLALFVTAFASCDLLTMFNHEHTFGEEWVSDTDYHWHACTVDEKCKETSERALHEFAPELDENGKAVNVCKVCGYKNDRVSTAPEHEHTFGTEYKFSDNFHWLECTTEGCFETSKSNEHQFGNPETTYADGKMTITHVCVDCGFKKSVTSVVDDKVENATEWDAVFGNFELTNFSMHVYFSSEGKVLHTNYCIVTEYGIYYHIEDGVEFYLVKENGQWIGYEKEFNYGTDTIDDGTFKLMTESQTELQELYEGACRETVLQISFAENYDKFVYDAQTGSYRSGGTIIATAYDIDGEEYPQKLHCVNSVVNVVNGEIMYIASDYYFNENSEMDTSFIYENIGHSEFSVPQYVIDEAKANS
jgi:hypothetical protein